MPVIFAQAVAALLFTSLAVCVLILLAEMLLYCLGKSERFARRQAKHPGKARWYLAGASTLGFVLILAGVILLRVQVSATVSGLSKLSDVGATQAYSQFWAVLWTSVGLLGANSVGLALDAFWNT
jgi:ABC-type Fe3+ transport system permease subunit